MTSSAVILVVVLVLTLALPAPVHHVTAGLDPRLVIAVALFLFYFISTQRFADKNPGVALLEGAELIRWKQVELAAKNLPSPPATPAVVDPTKPLPSILPGKEESDR